MILKGLWVAGLKNEKSLLQQIKYITTFWLALQR